MCGSQWDGNCFVLLCVMHTHSGQKLMWKEMKDRTISLKKSKTAWNCTYHLNGGLMNHIQGHRLNNLWRLLAFSSIWQRSAFQEMRVGDGTYPKCMPLVKCHTICWSLDQQIFFRQHRGTGIEFILRDVLNCVYIVKVEAIHGPLFVFKKNGSSGENANKLFCTLPQRRWGQYFSDKIQS